jgi:hypothetical protein
MALVFSHAQEALHYRKGQCANTPSASAFPEYSEEQELRRRQEAVAASEAVVSQMGVCLT